MEKIRIVVCDDNPNEREYYIALCRALGRKHGVDVRIKAYDSGRTLLFDLQEPGFMQTIDILQIEIDMPGLDGAAVAREARCLGYNGLIVFLTRLAECEFYEKAFDLHAINYIRKGKEHLKRLENVFLDAVDAVKKLRQEFIVLRCAGERRRIDIADIRYFEIMKYKMAAYYANECFEFISTMGKLESELLGRGFIRIHRAYTVSLNHVKSYTYSTVTLFDGTELPIGRTYVADFKKGIERWQI